MTDAKHTPGPWGHSGSDVNEAAQLRRANSELVTERDRLLAEITVLRGGFLQAEAKHAATQAELVAALRGMISVSEAALPTSQAITAARQNARAALARVEAQR